MKHLHNYSNYKIVNQYIKAINNAKSINELAKIEETLTTIKLDEGLLNFVKRSVKKVKNFFSGAGAAIDYLLMGDDEPKKKRTYNKEILLQYNEPKGENTDIYKIHNNIDATDHNFDFSSVFYSYNMKHNLDANLKDTPSVRVAKYKNSDTGNKTEYVIALYVLLDELEVDRDLYQHGNGAIESVTPSIFIYLKHIKETFPKDYNFNVEFKKFEDDLKQQYKKLLELPKFYDKKTHVEFGEKVFIKALNSVKLDMKQKGK